MVTAMSTTCLRVPHQRSESGTGEAGKSPSMKWGPQARNCVVSYLAMSVASPEFIGKAFQGLLAPGCKARQSSSCTALDQTGSTSTRICHTWPGPGTESSPWTSSVMVTGKMMAVKGGCKRTAHMQTKTIDPYLTAIQRILIPVVKGGCKHTVLVRFHHFAARNF
jgi:hypothetical protein